MWSLTSPRIGGTSEAKKFRSSAEKDFFNSIGQTEKSSIRADVFRYFPESGHPNRAATPCQAIARSGEHKVEAAAPPRSIINVRRFMLVIVGNSIRLASGVEFGDALG
jgi:hypothetical protein